MDSGAFIPYLRLVPELLRVVPGATGAFCAQLNYDPKGPRYFRQPVRFEVMDEGGGRIDLQGVYTAPSTPGTYTIRAVREDHSSVAAQAVVVVAWDRTE